jgi:hypothetical protein
LGGTRATVGVEEAFYRLGHFQVWASNSGERVFAQEQNLEN